MRDPSHPRLCLAGKDVPMATGVAIAAIAAVPADADALTNRPSGNPGADAVDQTDDLMTRHPRIKDAGKETLLGLAVAMADPASLDLDPDSSCSGLRDLALDQLQGTVRPRHLDNPHVRHFRNLRSGL